MARALAILVISLPLLRASGYKIHSQMSGKQLIIASKVNQSWQPDSSTRWLTQIVWETMRTKKVCSKTGTIPLLNVAHRPSKWKLKNMKDPWRTLLEVILLSPYPLPFPYPSKPKEAISIWNTEKEKHVSREDKRGTYIRAFNRNKHDELAVTGPMAVSIHYRA